MAATPFMPRTNKIMIGGINYTIQELLAVERDEFLFESADIMGETFTLLIENYLAGTDNLAELGVSVVLRGIIREGNGTPAQKADFIKRLILASVKSPKSASVDAEYKLHFTQHYEHRNELLWEIYKLNFGPAIQELKKKLQTSGIFIPKSSQDSPDENKTPSKKKPAERSLTVNYSSGE